MRESLQKPRRSWLPALLAWWLLALVGGAQEAAAPLERPVVRAVRVEGAQRYSDEQLRAAFGQRVGERLLGERELQRGVEQLFETFRVRTQVELQPLAGNEEEVELVLRVEELPLDPELRISGNHKIDDVKVREWAGLGAREELYLHQAPRLRTRILDGYRGEGFYFATVEVVERPAGIDPETGAPIAPDVILRIDEGPEVKVRDVKLHGNHAFPEGGALFFKRGLAKLAKVELRAARLGRLFAKDFVQEKLDADIVAMRQVYRDLGYLDALVEVDRLEFNERRNWVTIHVAIDEGPGYTVDEIELVPLRRVRDDSVEGGYREEPAELLVEEQELRGKLALQPGEVFLRRRVEEDHRTLRELYGALGRVEHPSLPAWEGFHFLEPELLFDPEEPRVTVRYRLVQGEPIRLREILVRGNLHTQDRVLRRLIANRRGTGPRVEPGALADPKEIERARGRLESTNFFSPDTFHPEIIPPRYRFVETGDPAVKDLEFLVEEGGVLGLNIGGGISTTNGAFGTLQLRKGNFDLGSLPSSFGASLGEITRLEAFHGAGQTLRLDASPGTEITRYSVSFFDPDIFHLHQDYIGLGLDASSQRRRYESHLEERRDYSLRLVRQLTTDSSVSLRYGIGSVEVSDLDTGGEPGLTTPLAVPRDLKAQEGSTDLARLELGYNFSTVDNRIVPRNGLDVSFRASLYDELLGSDAEFARAQVQLDFYDEFDEDPDLVSDYVRLGFTLGAGVAYGDSDEIPYTERVFLGGNQMRGFDFRGIGPNENGFPIGGTTSFLGTFEYRHPLVKSVQPGSYREIEAIQGGFFLDFGILDPEEFSLDWDELRISTGILFGISFPVPLTFSFGVPLREGDGDDTQVFEFDIGF